MTVRIVVDGMVQGVGFRFYALRRAEALGIRGEIWNRGDGSVELVAQHELTERLEAFEQALCLGPGTVAEIKAKPEESAKDYSGFEIVRPPTA
jgi:acylphosphatase